MFIRLTISPYTDSKAILKVYTYMEVNSHMKIVTPTEEIRKFGCTIDINTYYSMIHKRNVTADILYNIIWAI